MSSPRFNVVLLEISKQLSPEQLDNMKFLVPGELIGKKEKERTRSGLQLFQLLTERRRLAAEDTDYLRELLVNIQRHDLAEKLDEFHGQSGFQDQVLDPWEKDRLDVATRVISENLGRTWRQLGRRLQLSEVKLESISMRHPTDLEETAVELVKEWRRSRGAEARAQDLILALRACNYNLTADKVEDQLQKL